MLRIALMGAGTMGAHHARVISQSPRTELVAVIDTDLDRASEIAERYAAKVSADVKGAGAFDAVVLATPTEQHADQAIPLLKNGTPLLIEKPLAPSVDEVRSILDTGRSAGVPITCGFVERFNPAVATATALLVGRPAHMVSIRHSPAAPRIKTDVVHDLLIHDIDLALRVCGSETVSVTAAGWGPGEGPLQIVDATLVFANGGIATMSADRWSQRKIRSFSISSEGLLIELDLMRQDVTVYRHVGQELSEDGGSYRAETVVDIPFVRHAGEPLTLQLEHFVDLVEGKADGDEELRGLLTPHEVAARVQQQITTR